MRLDEKKIDAGVDEVDAVATVKLALRPSEEELDERKGFRLESETF